MGWNHKNTDKRGGVMAAGKELSVSQAVPLRPEDRQMLREVAARLGVGPGLLGRALILAGLGRIGVDGRIEDPAVQTMLAAEVEAERERQSQAGQAAMRARWGERPTDETEA